MTVTSALRKAWWVLVLGAVLGAVVGLVVDLRVSGQGYTSLWRPQTCLQSPWAGSRPPQLFLLLPGNPLPSYPRRSRITAQLRGLLGAEGWLPPTTAPAPPGAARPGPLTLLRIGGSHWPGLRHR